MATPLEMLCSAAKALGNVLLGILFIAFAPLFYVFCCVCWIRAKITALIVLNDKRSMSSGEDLMVKFDINPLTHIINGFFLINDHFTVEEMKELFLNTVINARDVNNKRMFPKFTRRIISCAGYLVWSEEDSFDIDDHIRPYHGQPPRDEGELKEVVNRICNNVLDPSKSNWEILIIPLEYGHENDPKTCTLFRIDHSITDAVSFGRLFYEQMCGNDNYLTEILFKNETESRRKNKLVTMLKDFGEFLFGALIAPFCFCRQALIYIQIFRGQRMSGQGLISDWSTVTKLSTVKEIKNATGTTVNDVFMSCVSAALMKFFAAQNVSPPNNVIVTIPVSFQRPGDPIEMKNKMSFMYSHLPIGDMDCSQRLMTIKALMDKLKRSLYVVSNRWIIRHCFNVIPFSLLRWFFSNFINSIVVSNVPGPLSKPAFNGHPLEAAVALPQIRGNDFRRFCGHPYLCR